MLYYGRIKQESWLKSLMDRVSIKNQAKQLLLNNTTPFIILGSVLLFAPGLLSFLISLLVQENVLLLPLLAVPGLLTIIGSYVFTFACLEFYRTKDTSFLDLKFLVADYAPKNKTKLIRAFVNELWAGLLTFLWSGLFIVLAVILFFSAIGSQSVLLLFLAFIVGSLANVISIYKAYDYYLTTFIAYDTDHDFRASTTYSTLAMSGHKLPLFIQHLSFIGWAIVAQITFGLGYILLLPYMVLSDVIYYQENIRSSDTLTQSEPVKKKIKLTPQ